MFIQACLPWAPGDSDYDACRPPQQYLYFLPEPHGHTALRAILVEIMG